MHIDRHDLDDVAAGGRPQRVGEAGAVRADHHLRPSVRLDLLDDGEAGRAYHLQVEELASSKRLSQRALELSQVGERAAGAVH